MIGRATCSLRIFGAAVLMLEWRQLLYTLMFGQSCRAMFSQTLQIGTVTSDVPVVGLRDVGCVDVALWFCPVGNSQCVCVCVWLHAICKVKLFTPSHLDTNITPTSVDAMLVRK